MTPGSTSSSLGKTFDPGRHQGNVREWLVGHRTTLPDEVVIDLSFIDREYRDLPFAYKDRCTGQIFCPWLIQWNALVGRAFKITERQGVEADLNVYNVTNNGAGQQFVNGNNQLSATFGSLQNVQLPRSAQISLEYHF